MKVLLYMYEKGALVVSSAQYIACLELLVTSKGIKFYFPKHHVSAVFQEL